MTLYNIWQEYISSERTWFIIVAIIILSLIKIKPLECNLLGWCIRWIGDNFNNSIYKKINSRFDDIEAKQISLESKIDKNKENMDKHEANEARTRILRFWDEMLHDHRHSKDSWVQIMRDIRDYRAYCDEHPEYENGVTGPASEHMAAIFEKHSDEADFFI